MSRRRPTGGPLPPIPGKGAKGAGTAAGKSFGGYKKQNVSDFQAHAKEIRDLASGQDFVESTARNMEKRPAPFDRQELQVVRSWVRGRPLETAAPASTMVPYPRQWNTKRGRYSKFRIGGSGGYGLIRARPTY